MSAATFARIASCVKLLLMAIDATIAAYTTIAMYGVWKRGCTRASADGSTPSRANANSARGLPSMSPETYPNIEIVPPASTSAFPSRPSSRPAVSANGASA